MQINRGIHTAQRFPVDNLSREDLRQILRRGIVRTGLLGETIGHHSIKGKDTASVGLGHVAHPRLTGQSTFFRAYLAQSHNHVSFIRKQTEKPVIGICQEKTEFCFELIGRLVSELIHILLGINDITRRGVSVCATQTLQAERASKTVPIVAEPATLNRATKSCKFGQAGPSHKTPELSTVSLAVYCFDPVKLTIETQQCAIQHNTSIRGGEGKVLGKGTSQPEQKRKARQRAPRVSRPYWLQSSTVSVAGDFQVLDQIIQHQKVTDSVAIRDCEGQIVFFLMPSGVSSK